MYEYYWGHTAAQIDLIDVDQPLTLFKSHKHDSKPGQKGFKKTAAEAASDYQRWKENKERLAKKFGKKIDLDTFLSTGKKQEVGV
jgi:hypothetical protein